MGASFHRISLSLSQLHATFPPLPPSLSHLLPRWETELEDIDDDNNLEKSSASSCAAASKKDRGSRAPSSYPPARPPPIGASRIPVSLQPLLPALPVRPIPSPRTCIRLPTATAGRGRSQHGRPGRLLLLRALLNRKPLWMCRSRLEAPAISPSL